MKNNVAERLVALMKSQGIEHVFGVPSGDWLPYMEAMEAGGIEFILVANEGSAGFMATVYAWLKGVPGVCYGTYGPGATNLSTGVGSALLDRAPVLVFTSERPDAKLGRTAQMMIDHQELMRPLTKWTTRLNPANVDQVFSRAIRVATEEFPGPVHIGLPGGIGEAPAPSGPVRATAPAVTPAPDPAAMEEMERMFLVARKPVLAVGLSAIRFEMGKQIAELAERHRIPVVLTPMAKGLVQEDHPLYAGVLFHALSDQVAETHGQADLVVGIGYDPVEFNYEDWMPEVPLIHLDPEPADIDMREYVNVLNVTGDPRIPLERLVALPSIDSDWDMNEIEDRRDRMFRDLTPEAGSFGPLAVLSILRDALPDEGIMTCDVGAHTHLIGQAWKTPHPFGQLMTNGWSSMGFGVPAAIAAKIARPDLPVACVTGDGGFMMMAGEMATAKRLGLPIVFLVLKDRALGLIKIKQSRRGPVTDATILCCNETAVSDYEFGVPVLAANNGETCRAALDRAFHADGPTIVEVEVDTAEYERLILRKHKAGAGKPAPVG